MDTYIQSELATTQPGLYELLEVDLLKYKQNQISNQDFDNTLELWESKTKEHVASYRLLLQFADDKGYLKFNNTVTSANCNSNYKYYNQFVI